jgi:hypothetical protein
VKIAHASIPADDPKSVAHVLAEIMGGEALPFPPGGPQAWMAWSGDAAIELEVVQRGNLMTFGDEEGGWQPAVGAERRSEVHLAICVTRPASEVIAIAERAGWPARPCQRGNGLFELTEVWIEGVFMVEVLDPIQTARYEQVVTPANLKRLFTAPDMVVGS